MANLLARLFGLHDTRSDPRVDRPTPPILPTLDTRPVPLSPAPTSDTLPPLKNWSHPFKDKDPLKDKRNPLSQLTHMAKAKAGYFPLGRSGLWHGGVHFDSGTAGGLNQSSVQCLADGEVVAYRIDTQAPTTTYFVNKQTVEKPVLAQLRAGPPSASATEDRRQPGHAAQPDLLQPVHAPAGLVGVPGGHRHRSPGVLAREPDPPGQTDGERRPPRKP